jgi:hypothetical protein
MKIKISERKAKKIDWESISEETRRHCNKLSDGERRHYLSEALKVVYSTDAETKTRRGRY